MSFGLLKEKVTFFYESLMFLLKSLQT